MDHRSLDDRIVAALATARLSTVRPSDARQVEHAFGGRTTPEIKSAKGRCRSRVDFRNGGVTAALCARGMAQQNRDLR